MAENDYVLLDRAIEQMQATAYNFAAAAISDSRVRLQYERDLKAMATEIKEAVRTGKMSANEGATLANNMRNSIMDLLRTRTSPLGLAFAKELKAQGKTLSELMEHYAGKLFKQPMSLLNEAQQTAVCQEIVQAAGRSNPKVNALLAQAGKIGRRVYLVSLTVGVYEIYEAENKPREISRQGVLMGTGIAGGWAAGAGAVALGACAATAPVCIGIAVLAGGILASFGADLAFDSIYPKPARVTR